MLRLDIHERPVHADRVPHALGDPHIVDVDVHRAEFFASAAEQAIERVGKGGLAISQGSQKISGRDPFFRICSKLST